MTAVQLDQHSLPVQALVPYPVLGRASSSWTVPTGVDQDAPQGGPADVDALSFAEQLCQMGVVGSLVNRAGQVNHPVPDRLGNGVGRPAAPEAMGKGGGSVLPVSRQNAPGMSGAQSHKRRRLVQCHVLGHQTVQNLESRLFSGYQSHILHGVNVTFLLAS